MCCAAVFNYAMVKNFVLVYTYTYNIYVVVV